MTMNTLTMNELVVGKYYECYYRQDLEDNTMCKRYMGRVRMVHYDVSTVGFLIAYAETESPMFWLDFDQEYFEEEDERAEFQVEPEIGTWLIDFSDDGVANDEFFEFIDTDYCDCHKKKFATVLNEIKYIYMCTWCEKNIAVIGYKPDGPAYPGGNPFVYFRNHSVSHALCDEKTCRECEWDSRFGDHHFLKCDECEELGSCWRYCCDTMWICTKCMTEQLHDNSKD